MACVCHTVNTNLKLESGRQMFVAFFSVSPCLLRVKQCLICKINKPFHSMAPTPFGCVVFGYASHSFGSVVFRCNFILSPSLIYGRIHFKFQHVTGKWIQKHKKFSCCYAVAMLPFCFLWSLSTRGDHRYVIYDVTGLCVGTRSLEMNCKLQNWMFTSLLRILSWLLWPFRTWKCAVACILEVW